MSIVLLSLASAQCHGRSSTVMCRCPTRGETLRAPAPNTGTMRTFSARYWIWTTPWASGPGSGGSTTSLGAGSFSMARYGETPRTSLALWANAPVASTAPAATAASILMSMVTPSSGEVRHDIRDEQLTGLCVVPAIGIDQQVDAGGLVLPDQIDGLGHAADKAAHRSAGGQPLALRRQRGRVAGK